MMAALVSTTSSWKMFQKEITENSVLEITKESLLFRYRNSESAIEVNSRDFHCLKK